MFVTVSKFSVSQLVNVTMYVHLKTETDQGKGPLVSCHSSLFVNLGTGDKLSFS